MAFVAARLGPAMAGPGRANLVGRRSGEPEVLAREPKTERAARAKALVVALGPGADVDPQVPSCRPRHSRWTRSIDTWAWMTPSDCTWIAPTTRPSASATSVVTPGALSARAVRSASSVYSVQPSAATRAISPSRWACAKGSIDGSVMSRAVRRRRSRSHSGRGRPRLHPWRFQLSCSASPMMMPSGPRRKQRR
jgi:hypothetical protein